MLPRSAEVTCEYLGVLKDDGFTLEAKPTLRSTVGYKGSYRDNSVEVSHTKKARYDYSVEHNTSLPEQWKTALKCSRLPGIARESAALFEEESRLRDVSCRVVGVPRPVAIHLDALNSGPFSNWRWGLLLLSMPFAHRSIVSPGSVIEAHSKAALGVE